MTVRFPQSYQQIGQILEILQRLHADVSLLCEKGRAELGESGRGQLVGLFAERQKEMMTFIDNTRGQCNPKVLATWMQFVPFEQIEKQREEMQTDSTTLEELPEQVMGIQTKIAEFIHALEMESEFAEEHALLEMLGERERGEVKYCTAVLRGLEDV